MDIEIIHQDQDILVINKPAGIVVNKAKSVREPTVQDWVSNQLSDIQESQWQELVPTKFDDQYGAPVEIFNQRQGLAHRLDKDTSGVMVWAKNPGSLVNLMHQFKQHQVKKKYTCLTHGKFRIPEGTISAPLGRARVDRQKFAVVSEGREAVTEYQVAQYYPGFSEQGRQELEQIKKKLSLYQGFSLVDCWPKTGRTHQIRVHMKHWLHPLVGDDKYVGKRRAKLDKMWCPRQFLHAARLEFVHPRTQKEVNFTADLTQDLEQVLKFLS
jgi:23S rRNA pseudouridine1911/1915/1917 synthase